LVLGQVGAMDIPPLPLRPVVVEVAAGLER
jgi:hypothetical protein